jgi:hypothetical protein
MIAFFMTQHCIVEIMPVYTPPGQVWPFYNADIVGHVLNLATRPIRPGDLKPHFPEL